MRQGSGPALAVQERSQLQTGTHAQLATDLRLIADESRLRILSFLADGEQCVCRITEVLGLSQPLASYHLGILRDAGLVTDRRDSRWVYYSINVERLREISGRFGLHLDVDQIEKRASARPPQQCVEIEHRE